MISGTVVKTRLGHNVSAVWTTLLAFAALSLIGLGSEIAFSNTQTNNYSLGSIFWDAAYFALVVIVPILIAKLWRLPRRRNRTSVIRRASVLYMCAQLLFLPFLFLLATM